MFALCFEDLFGEYLPEATGAHSQLLPGQTQCGPACVKKAPLWLILASPSRDEPGSYGQ